ncbi:hypothetical protein C0992_005118 [Termitomyces sp. T32_za158]|nr:hypothetical protein C0992_005118 [Termitomyces sp. T32_za158]
MPLSQPSPDDTQNSRESIRASVFDVCLQLGALDDDSLVAQWMFNDRSVEDDSLLCRQNPTTRFKEMISSECLVVPDIEVPDERRRRRLLPFSVRAPAFTKHLSRPQSQPSTNKGSLIRKGPLGDVASNRMSISRGSLLKRKIDSSQTNERTSKTVGFDDGSVPPHPRTFLQRKSSILTPSQADSSPRSHSQTHPVRIVTSSIDTPIHSRFTKPQALDDPRACTVKEDDSDSDWEEIEANSDYLLPNEGMNSMAAFPLPIRSQRQSTRTIDSDFDGGIVYSALRHKFSFALPRVLFRQPSKEVHNNHSSQRRRNSSSLKFTTSSSSKKTSVESSRSSSTPRKQLRMKITKEKHFRSRSEPLPPSPFVLLTSRDNDADPAMHTTQIVFSSETPLPASRSAIEAQTSCSMGHHHQFFVQAQEAASKTSLNNPVAPFSPP